MDRKIFGIMWFWFKIRLIFWKVKSKLILISNIFNKDVVLVKISDINIIFKRINGDDLKKVWW